MTLAEAKMILHPDIPFDTIDVDEIKEACVVACEAIDKLEEIRKWMEQYAKNDLQ